MAETVSIPQSIEARIRRHIWHRTALTMLSTVLMTTAVFVGVALFAMGVDALILLPVAVRLAFRVGLIFIPFAGLLLMVLQLLRLRATEDDLRRLDNENDDLRATLNLARRVQAGDESLSIKLVSRTVTSGRQLGNAPLPRLQQEKRYLRFSAVAVLIMAGSLVAARFATPDLHTALIRLQKPTADVGTVGHRKFQVTAEIWKNPSIVSANGEQEDEAAAAAAAKSNTLYFLREHLTDNGWQPHFPQSFSGGLADAVAGYNPLAVANHSLPVLQGDRIVLSFTAVDNRQTRTLHDVEFYRHNADRELNLRFQKVAGEGIVTINRVQRDHAFQLRSREQHGPRYNVQVIPRPSPRRMYLIEQLPGHYGRAVRQSIIRDNHQEIALSRLSGLPGSRLTVEFATPYGADLDRARSYAQIGENSRLKLRYLTSQNRQRRDAGEKLWTFAFVLNESIPQDAKLYLHLVTENERFEGQPIVNIYDEPFLVHQLEDLPPSVEMTSTPQKRHFASDDIFAFRYHYADDYGVAEALLELDDDPVMPVVRQTPLPIRPPQKSGTVRKEDELMQIVDLSNHRYGMLDFWVMITDLSGQEARTAPISITMSDHLFEKVLPRLTGGWNYYRSHALNTPIFRPGDVEHPPAVQEFATFAQGLEELLRVMQGDIPQAEQLRAIAKQLNYRYQPLFQDRHMPNEWHYRTYPYYFHRQAETYLSSIAALDGRDVYSKVRDYLQTMAETEKPAESEAFNQLSKLAEFITDQLQFVRLMQGTRSELVLRASLLRIAHFGRNIMARLAEIGPLVEQLRRDAGDAPEARAEGDPWQTYPEWVEHNHPDFNLRQRAQFVRLQIERVNRKLAELNRELQSVLKIDNQTLDGRFLAVLQMVESMGSTLYNLNREELLEKTPLLVRFIRHGILMGDESVFNDIITELESCRRNAETAAALLAECDAFGPVFEQLMTAVDNLADQRLEQRLGAPVFPDGTTARWQNNQRSRMQSHLERLTRLLDRIRYGQTFRDFADLPALRTSLIELDHSLQMTLEWLDYWPDLHDRENTLKSCAKAALTIIEQIDVLRDVRKYTKILAGFEPVFRKGTVPDFADPELITEIQARLVALRNYPEPAPELSRGRRELLKLRQALETEADEIRLAEIKKQIAEIEKEEVAFLARLQEHFLQLAVLLKQVPVSPPGVDDDNGREEVEMPKPHPLISAHSSQLFNATRPDAMIKRAMRQIKLVAEHPAMQQAVGEAFTGYFRHAPTETGRNPVGNAIQEYLQARVALALVLTSPGYMETVVKDCLQTGNDRKNVILAYFAERELPDEVREHVQAQDYKPLTIPPVIQPLLAPYLDAGRTAQLPESLNKMRAQRLHEILILCQNTDKIVDRHEALVRVHALLQELVEMRENVELLHYEPEDIRIENMWINVREQALALDRDWRAGNLSAIAEEDAKALRAGLKVFAAATYADVGEDAKFVLRLNEYEARLKTMHEELMPAAMQAHQAIRDDLPQLRKDLALFLFTTFSRQAWLERKLEADLIQKKVLLQGVTGSERVEKNIPLGSLDDALLMQEDMHLLAYAWRAATNLSVLKFAAAPTDQERLVMLHDYARLACAKTLPEFYYDGFIGTAARRPGQGGVAADARVERMLEVLRDARQVHFEMISYLLNASIPPTIPSASQELTEGLNVFQLLPTVLRQEKEFAAYQELYTGLIRAQTTGDVQAMARKARSNSDSRGQYWRLLGRPVARFLEIGRPALDAEHFLLLEPEIVRQRLLTQQDALREALDCAGLIGSGLNETQTNELAVLEEARLYVAEWSQALQKGHADAAENLRLGYRDIHEAVRSYLQSIESYMFPEVSSYPPRLRYRERAPHLADYGFLAELQNTEEHWFRLADRAHSRVFRESFTYARASLAGASPDSTSIAFAFHRYLETKYRYMMSWGSPGTAYSKPPPRLRQIDSTIPEHLGRALFQALTVDLPKQDNRLIRKLYFETLQEDRQNTFADDNSDGGDENSTEQETN